MLANALALARDAGGAVYAHERRLATVDNALDAPSATDSVQELESGEQPVPAPRAAKRATFSRFSNKWYAAS